MTMVLQEWKNNNNKEVTMPKLEMFEIEEREVYTEVEITEEQAEEYKEYQNGGEYPEWVDEIDWDEGEKTWRDGNTSVVHVEVIEED